MATKSDDVEKFKHAIKRQNSVERAPGGSAKQKRDAAEGEAAHHGLGPLHEQSKGRPHSTATEQSADADQKATTKKSPQAARSQAR